MNAYRRAVASLCCVNCGLEGRSQAAHANGIEYGKGMGRKADDSAIFPLCADGPGYRRMPQQIRPRRDVHEGGAPRDYAALDKLDTRRDCKPKGDNMTEWHSGPPPSLDGGRLRSTATRTNCASGTRTDWSSAADPQSVNEVRRADCVDHIGPVRARRMATPPRRLARKEQDVSTIMHVATNMTAYCKKHDAALLQSQIDHSLTCHRCHRCHRRSFRCSVTSAASGLTRCAPTLPPSARQCALRSRLRTTRPARAITCWTATTASA